MVRNHLLVSHAADSIQLFWQRRLSAPRSAPSVKFTHPFDEEALAELRWYLEEYLRFPYGLEPDRARKIEQKFQGWGEELFSLVFPRSTIAWDFFQEATHEGLDLCELSISSDDPAILNLPWELLYGPGYQFLAPSLAGIYRSLNGQPVRAEFDAMPQDQLNVLLVIARPYGERDIGLKTIARPMLEALEPIRKRVNLKVLRPPSFEQLERELNERKGFYHIVHFDGHGDFDPASQGFQHSLGSSGQGVLVFENLDGSPQIVTAAQIAQSLTNCRVPIFMLNACKSAQEGEGSFSSVATRLVALGAKSVVAMAYSIYAEAAKHFIGRIYEQLVRGDTVSMAVAAGRREILNKQERPSPRGRLPLQDWLVPVLYQQETYAPFVPLNSGTLDIESFLEEPDAQKLIDFPDEGTYGFIGRDYDILRLERSLRQNSIVVLQGMAGVGKTRLACGFARWLVETQGRSLCFFQSFEHGATLANIVYQVGRTVWGDKFSQCTWEQQRHAVIEYLRTKPTLMVWDNFESVAGFTEEGEPLLLNQEQESLKKFLREVRSGQSQILITSRQEEAWLDCGYTLQILSGLIQEDAEEIARRILQNIGIDQSSLPPEYLDLLERLNGHPLSLRMVLPHLKSQSPVELIEALDRGSNTLEEQSNLERNNSLITSLDYSFDKLSEKAQHHLPFLGLFVSRFNSEFIVNFVNGFKEKDPLKSKEVYKNFFGESLTRQEWLRIIDEAVGAGILEKIETNCFEMHPTLPWYLYQRLSSYRTRDTLDELEHRLLLFYIMLGTLGAPEYNGGSTEESISHLMFEEPNLLRYMRFAENKQDWNGVWSILTGLGDAYNILGLWGKFNSLRQHFLQKLGNGFSKTILSDEGALNLYIYLQGAVAHNAVRLGQIKEAKEIQQEILDELLKINLFSVEEKIATAAFNLGIIYKEERLFNEATTFYRKALETYQKVDTPDNPNFLTALYNELGIVNRLQGHLEKAEECFREALECAQKLNNQHNIAWAYYELAELFHIQGRLETAKDYCQQSIHMYQNFSDLYKVAASYDLMGMILLENQEYQQAAFWYQQALQIYEDEQDEYNASDEYHGLGEVSKAIGNLDDAIAYFVKALDIRNRYQNFYKAAATYSELGKTLEKKGNLKEALIYYINAFIIDFQIAREHINEDMQNLARMLSQVGDKSFGDIWQEVTEQNCPNEILIALTKLMK